MRPLGIESLGNVLITGGASGLGAATAQAVLAAGGRPLVLDRNAPSTDVDYVQADLADRSATEGAVAALVAAGGGRLQAVSQVWRGPELPAPAERSRPPELHSHHD